MLFQTLASNQLFKRQSNEIKVNATSLMINEYKGKYWVGAGLFMLWMLFSSMAAIGQSVYQFHLNEEVGPAAWRKMNKAFQEAREGGASVVLININTYGGALNYADSMRSRILGSPMKTIAYINHNAASAGALIALACERIYMAPGASIGAASVVNPQGEVMPEKFQSYMRSLMRATAEARGRDPRIAEAFVDPDISIPELNNEGKVLTLTSKEAVRVGVANGEVADLHDLLTKEGLESAPMRHYQVSWIDQLIDFFINPAVSGVLILLIIGGIYFEMQSPGIGFALLVAIVSALLFFAPLYMEGLADHWEIGLSVLGVVLLLLEVFVIPGFGVAGILGIIALVCGLAFSMIPNETFDFRLVDPAVITMAFVTVLASSVGSIILCVIFGKSILRSSAFQRLVLNDEQRAGQGYVSTITDPRLIRQEGIAKTDLRPSGKIEIAGKWYDAVALDGFIEKGTSVYVERLENSHLFVRKKLEIQDLNPQ